MRNFFFDLLGLRESEHALCSVAFPVIGAGTGGFDVQISLAIIASELSATESEAVAIVVRSR